MSHVQCVVFRQPCNRDETVTHVLYYVAALLAELAESWPLTTQLLSPLADGRPDHLEKDISSKVACLADRRHHDVHSLPLARAEQAAAEAAVAVVRRKAMSEASVISVILMCNEIRVSAHTPLSNPTPDLAPTSARARLSIQGAGRTGPPAAIACRVSSAAMAVL